MGRKSMKWNHRVVRFKTDDPDFSDWFEICEVYYHEDGEAFSHTAEGVAVSGHSLEELRETLQRMLKAIDHPVMECLKGEGA
jgi:hypothetical protein